MFSLIRATSSICSSVNGLIHDPPSDVEPHMATTILFLTMNYHSLLKWNLVILLAYLNVASAFVAAPRTFQNDVILYDGVCNFCNTWVDILLRIDVGKKFRFAPLQSSVGRELLVSVGKEADDISSVVLVKATTRESFDKSRCVLKVVEELGPVAKIASNTALSIVPEQIRDEIYDTVAENRYNLMGKRDECRCSDPQFADRFLLD